MRGVVQQRGLPVQVDAHIAQLTRYRRLPGLQQQLAALLMGKAGALQEVRHPLSRRDRWRVARAARAAAARIDAPRSPGVSDAG